MAQAIIMVIVVGAVSWWAFLVVEPMLAQRLGLEPLRIRQHARKQQ